MATMDNSDLKRVVDLLLTEKHRPLVQEYRQILEKNPTFISEHRESTYVLLYRELSREPSGCKVEDLEEQTLINALRLATTMAS